MTPWATACDGACTFDVHADHPVRCRGPITCYERTRRAELDRLAVGDAAAGIDLDDILAEVAYMTNDPDASPGRQRLAPPPRQAVLALWGAACVKCGSPWALERAHVIDQALGGGSTVYDVRPLCAYCHRVQPSFSPGEEVEALIWFYDQTTAFWRRGDFRLSLLLAHAHFSNPPFYSRSHYHERLRLLARRLAVEAA